MRKWRNCTFKYSVRSFYLLVFTWISPGVPSSPGTKNPSWELIKWLLAESVSMLVPHIFDVWLTDFLGHLLSVAQRAGLLSLLHACQPVQCTLHCVRQGGNMVVSIVDHATDEATLATFVLQRLLWYTSPPGTKEPHVLKR